MIYAKKKRGFGGGVVGGKMGKSKEMTNTSSRYDSSNVTSKVLNLPYYLILGAGLSLILLSGPLPIMLLARGTSDHYRGFLKDILRNWGFEMSVLPLWLTPLSYIILIATLALVGFLVWAPFWNVLRCRIQTSDASQRIYCYWIIFLSGVAILGDLLFLALVFFITVLGFGFGTKRGPRETQLFLLSVFLLGGFLLGHMALTLRTARYHRGLTGATLTKKNVSRVEEIED